MHDDDDGGPALLMMILLLSLQGLIWLAIGLGLGWMLWGGA